MTSIGIQYLNVLETQRSNRANEHIKIKTLAETSRHNIATEQLQSRSIDESIRHNMAVEAENHRSNIARELEAERHNRAVEIEENRANKAREKENSIHNMETEEETQRHNEVVEGNTRYQTNLNAMPSNVAGAIALKDSGKDTAANKAGASFATAINSLGTLGSAIGSLLRGSKSVFN